MRIDASVGLKEALPKFKLYRVEGALQAKVSHIPGFRGELQCFIQLINGNADDFCIIEEQKSGQRHLVPLEVVVQADNKRGPFEWSLVPTQHPSQSPVSEDATTQQPQLPVPYASPPLQLSPDIDDRNTIPIRIKPSLDLTVLTSVPRQKQFVLRVIFNFVDDHRSVAEVKERLPHLSKQTIEWALAYLIDNNFVTISKENSSQRET